jgi:serine/threonine protein kinase/Tol biopolymer transport system component
MALSSGTKLGPYEIQSPLGAGGMGEVYRARDTRLDRTVAVKILPAHLSDNPEARQRFEREARAISSLNHPHICVLHDVGIEDGTSYLVMEYIQGESLDARLQKGPLPLRQALECGVQICEALEKAHRAGIVHRDLKPGNIMLTSTGAKLLDFGLAKPASALLGAQPITSKGQLTPSTPTMNLSAMVASASPLTQQGSIVGTFQFMAPEVLQGQEADARSDIFSFGCVLYEMITGRRAFEGKSQISVASAILEKDPEPVTKVLPLAPIALDHVVNDCLAKDPEVRWQNAADVARQLRWIATGGSGITPAPASPRHRRLRAYWPWAAVIAALLVALLWTNWRTPEPQRVIRSFLPPPAETGFDFTGDFSGPPAITSDGTMIAFCARSQKDRNAVWVQSLSDLLPKKLDGTEGASFPFWSADAKFVGFFADGRLKKVQASGGPVTVLAEAPNPRGGSWNQDNVIIYEPDYRDSLFRIAAAGGTPERLTKFESGKHTTHRWPRFMPDGKHFLFFATNHSGSSEQGIYFGSLADGSYKHVLDADSDAQYASGYILYHLQSQLLTLKFNPSTGAVSGEPAPVANLVEYDSGTWHTTFAVSQNGILIYEPGSKTLGTDLFWLDLNGKQLGRVADRNFYKGSGRVSPDGKRLAVSMGDPQADVWVFDLQRGSRTRLTFGGATHLTPSWSADGQRVVYVKQFGSTVMSGTAICARLASGGGQEEVLMQGDHSSSASAHTLLSPQWSPDGNSILHIQQNGPTNAAVWLLPLSGEKKPVPIVQSPSAQSRIVQYRLSPDGRWLAFSSTESGREEVYVTHFPSGQGRWQVSQNGGTFPTWRGDSRQIFFIALDNSIQSVNVNVKSAEFESDPVKTLFRFNYAAPVGNPFDVTPDGQRLLFSTYPESAPTPLVLVTNWIADLKK